MYDAGDALGGLPGVQPHVATFPFLSRNISVSRVNRGVTVDAMWAARVDATLDWGAPVVAAVGIAAAILLAMRLLALVAATREARAASAATRDSIMAFFFHELRTPLHAAIGLLQALREDAGEAAAGARVFSDGVGSPPSPPRAAVKSPEFAACSDVAAERLQLVPGTQRDVLIRMEQRRPVEAAVGTIGKVERRCSACAA